MWKIDTKKAYPFKHKHPNLFPPSPQPQPDSPSQSSHPSYSSHHEQQLESETESEEDWTHRYLYDLSNCTHPSLLIEPLPSNSNSNGSTNDQEVPIVFRRPSGNDLNLDISPTDTMPNNKYRGADMLSPSTSRLPPNQQPNWPLIPAPLHNIGSGKDAGTMVLRQPQADPGPPPPVPTPPPLYISTMPSLRRRPTPLISGSSTPRANSRPLLLPPHIAHLYPTPSPNTHGHKRTTSDEQPPPTPSSLAPANVTSLLSSVLSIMNEILSQQALVASENELLEDLTELVVILQEEAEEMLVMSDLVEEYAEVVDFEREQDGEEEDIVRWGEDLGVGIGLGLGIAGLDLEGDYGDEDEDQRESMVEDGWREWEREGYGEDKEGVRYGYEREMDEERRRKEYAGGKGYGYGHERDDSLDSGLGMDDMQLVRWSDKESRDYRPPSYNQEPRPRREDRERSHHQRQPTTPTKPERIRPRKSKKESSKRDSAQSQKHIPSHSRKSSRREAEPSTALVRISPRKDVVDVDRSSESRSKESTKSKTSAPRFRDSALDVVNPGNSLMSRSSRKPKWI